MVAYIYDDGSGILYDGTRFVSTEEEYTSRYRHYRSFCTEDGKYGLWYSYESSRYDWWGSIVVPGVCDTREEAVSAGRFYRINEENGKPVVGYGNDIIGFEPVIRYCKNNLYYDEIQSLGEGYYACRFGTTWYLLHA